MRKNLNKFDLTKQNYSTTAMYTQN